MILKMQFSGVWEYRFEVANCSNLRVGCYEGWTALRAWASDIGRELGPDPTLLLRDAFTKTQERWVVAGFTWPPTEGQLVMVPDPFRTTPAEWDALFQRIRRAHQALIVAAPIMDAWERSRTGQPHVKQ